MALTTTDQDAIARASARSGVPSSLLSAVAMQESGGDPNAVNKQSGATGLFQVLQSTANNPGYGVAPLQNRNDPYQSADFAADYLKAQYQRTGSWDAAVKQYSGGGYDLNKLGLNSSGLPGPGTGSGVSGGNAGANASTTGSAPGGSGSSSSSSGGVFSGVLNGVWEIVSRGGLMLLGICLILVALVAMLYKAAHATVDADDLHAAAEGMA